MLTLNVFGPQDHTIENVTRDQMDALLNEDQSNVRLFCLDYPNGSLQLVIGHPVSGHAIIKTYTHQGVEKIEFDNVPDAISAFRELTAHLFKA